jgi:glycosyltransferase involved in cell wall biosynthesis
MIKMPRVSVVIINWNYGRYVGQAIQSVKDQTYQNLECIIVDNGSDDESVDVIADAIRNHPEFTLHKLPRNLGQLGGALYALRHVRHEYVTFLDSDDVLFPDFLATHVQVHIGTEHPTGFTSSTTVDINADGEVITGGNWWMLRSWKEAEPSLRSADKTVRLDMFDHSAYSSLAERTRYLPMYRPGWNWCVGSSNMYRRVLMERILPSVSTETVFGGVDGYFTPILHAITGTNLIDRLLNAYRVHGANDFSMLPGLVGVNSSYGQAESRSYATAKLTLVSLIDKVDELLKTAPANRFWQILDVVASTSKGRRMFSESEIKKALIGQYRQLAGLFGEQTLIRELRHRMPWNDCLEIVRAVQNGKNFLSAILCLASAELHRKFHRIRKTR